MSLQLAAHVGDGTLRLDADELRQKGDAIYANLWLIEPGQKELKLDNLTVALNPDLKAVENAQQYFREYDKARQALSRAQNDGGP